MLRDPASTQRRKRLISYESKAIADGESVDISEAERHEMGRPRGAETFETSMGRARSLLATLDGGLLILDPGAFPIVVAEYGHTALEDGKEKSPHGHHDDYRTA